MNGIELQIKQDENTIKDIAEKMQRASNTKMLTKTRNITTVNC